MFFAPKDSTFPILSFKMKDAFRSSFEITYRLAKSKRKQVCQSRLRDCAQ